MQFYILVLTGFPLDNSSQTGEQEVVVTLDGRFNRFHANPQISKKWGGGVMGGGG